MNKLNKLVTVMAVTTMTLGVNAGDMKQKLIGMANPVTDTPTLIKTDTKEELQKETMAELKGWTLAYQVNVLQKESGIGCLIIKKAVGVTQATKHDNQNCRKSPIED